MEHRLASMESKNSGKRKNSPAASPSDSTPADSLLASVQKPTRPEPNQPNASNQGSESESEHFVMPVVSSDNTPSHVTGNSSSLEKEVDGGSTDEGKSGSPRAKRKAKRKKVISVSCTNTVARVKRSDCWNLFRVVAVPSKKEKEVTDTKAKCKFCHKLFAYKKEGATTTLNRHIQKCIAYLNKLSRKKAQSLLGFNPDMADVSKSEWLIYLDEQTHPLADKDFTLLDWWRLNTHRFLVVSRMAKKFLTVPASSVSSTSTFSTRGRVLDDYRSSLRPTMVEALICASSWIHGSHDDKAPPMAVEEDNEDDVESIPFPESVVASN